MSPIEAGETVAPSAQQIKAGKLSETDAKKVDAKADKVLTKG